jgi:WhiB family redox-sensing transcriptional regulator
MTDSMVAALDGGPTYASAVSLVLHEGERPPCQGDNGRLFFSEHPWELERAKELCAGCPVRLHCLAGAIQRREPWGVWGGQVFDGGVDIERKRPRGRPRKTGAHAQAIGG